MSDQKIDEVTAKLDKKDYLELDEDGYPTDDTLKKIEEYKAEDYRILLEQVRKIWRYAENGKGEPDYFWTQPYEWEDLEKGIEYHLSTAGWSGNEDIVQRLESNHIFWMLHWYSSKRGGHYVFRFPDKKIEEKMTVDTKEFLDKKEGE